MLLAQSLVTAYGFVLGACVGSFLNVVAWRLPRGMSLVKPASHCPACKSPIKLRDNVPVLGWILLRGRCRACGCKISPRYPLVEFATGAAFALLAYYELATGGGNLPARVDAWKPLMPGLPFDWVLLGLWIYHVTLVSILATIALVEFDESRLPRAFFLFALCAGWLSPLVWPELRAAFLSAGDAANWNAVNSAQESLRSLIFGAVLGTCLGWSFDPRRSERNRVIQLAAATGVVGLFLGGSVPFIVSFAVGQFLLVARLVSFAIPSLKRVTGSALVLVVVLWVLPREWSSSFARDAVPVQSAFGTFVAPVFAIAWFMGVCLIMFLSFQRWNRLAEERKLLAKDDREPPLDPR